MSVRTHHLSRDLVRLVAKVKSLFSNHNRSRDVVGITGIVAVYLIKKLLRHVGLGETKSPVRKQVGDVLRVWHLSSWPNVQALARGGADFNRTLKAKLLALARLMPA